MASSPFDQAWSQASKNVSLGIIILSIASYDEKSDARGAENGPADLREVTQFGAAC